MYAQGGRDASHRRLSYNQVILLSSCLVWYSTGALELRYTYSTVVEIAVCRRSPSEVDGKRRATLLPYGASSQITAVAVIDKHLQLSGWLLTTARDNAFKANGEWTYDL